MTDLDTICQNLEKLLGESKQPLDPGELASWEARFLTECCASVPSLLEERRRLREALTWIQNTRNCTCPKGIGCRETEIMAKVTAALGEGE